MLKMPEIDTEEPRSIVLESAFDTPTKKRLSSERGRFHLLRQLTRFGLVGGLNTLIDILALNLLLLLWPTTSTPRILLYNALAYAIGAGNSFVCNKYWTFQQRQAISRRELLRFTLTTLCGMALNSALLWCAGLALRSLPLNATLWANASKVLAISATMLVSFLGMRLWVFASKGQQRQVNRLTDGEKYSLAGGIRETGIPFPEAAYMSGPTDSIAWTMPPRGREGDRARDITRAEGSGARERHSLSVVLPAYNEEEVIADTIMRVLAALQSWQIDSEVLVVNDGSSDRTGEIIAELATHYPQVHLINHTRNQGYGAALVSGFQAATKELTFFMDSDGQFDIHALSSFFPLIDSYDAVLGYRLKRQDSWMRKLNAWGWKMLVRAALGVKARDLDCAFKLFHTSFLHAYPLETRGAMINAELLYRLKQGHFTQHEIGVPHLPRRGGRATGAHPRVIARALRDLFLYTWRWKREARARTRHMQDSSKYSV